MPPPAEKKVTPERSRNMAAIKSKNTKPELLVRRYLHAQGFRYRLHFPHLPGKPDLVLKKYRLVVHVHGCFWHRHRNCFYSSVPQARPEFWRNKFLGNIQRDRKNNELLRSRGWRILVIWECGLKHRIENLPDLCPLIKGDRLIMEWPETPPRLKNLPAL